MSLSRNKTVRSAMKSYGAVGRAIQDGAAAGKAKQRRKRDGSPPGYYPPRNPNNPYTPVRA